MQEAEVQRDFLSRQLTPSLSPFDSKRHLPAPPQLTSLRVRITRKVRLLFLLAHWVVDVVRRRWRQGRQRQRRRLMVPEVEEVRVVQVLRVRSGAAAAERGSRRGRGTDAH